MKTTVDKQKSKADLKREQIEKDKTRAAKLTEVIDELEREYSATQDQKNEALLPLKEEYERKTAPVESLFNPRLESNRASYDAAAKELLEIGQRQRFNLFDVKGNWRFENGFYIHAKTKTEVITGEAFDLSKFVKKFAKYIDVKFKIAPLVKLFTDADLRKKSGIDKHAIELKNTETLEIKFKSEANDKED